MDAGYVYVLMNPSMPGLVKVGKTNRDPNDRLLELSAATGVPTPFVLVYSAYFADCLEAEQFVHATLETSGYRLTSNREFFHAPVQEVIDAVLKAKASLARPGEEFGLEDAETDVAEEEEEEEDDDEDDFFSKLSDEPWEAIDDQASAYWWGSGETLQDYKKAFNLFSQAARMGSANALDSLARMLREGQGCVKDDELALEYFETQDYPVLG